MKPYLIIAGCFVVLWLFSWAFGLFVDAFFAKQIRQRMQREAKPQRADTVPQQRWR